MESSFYRCSRCNNIVGLVNKGGGQLVCCNEAMELLVPGSVEAAVEKHIPEISVDGNSVCIAVGSVLHPMLVEHSIKWVYLKTENGGHRMGLKPGQEPKVEFCVPDGDKPLAAFAYCDLHGLWAAKI